MLRSEINLVQSISGEDAKLDKMESGEQRYETNVKTLSEFEPEEIIADHEETNRIPLQFEIKQRQKATMQHKFSLKEILAGGQKVQEADINFYLMS